MNPEENINYSRIAIAIEYLQAHYRSQPTLDEVAGQVHLSPYHFQRLFSEWAGISPKKFLQYLSLEHAKKMLKEQSTLFEAALDTGLSGISRLHDLFIGIEGMTPGEYKNGGENLQINYSFAGSPFGTLLVASTSKGICHMAFVQEEEDALETLKAAFPQAAYQDTMDAIQENALHIFRTDWSKIQQIRLHLKGTPFQLKVWETLLRIPVGKLTTYGNIAQHMNQPGASRAIGTAVGDNPVAFIIPCHRVIRAGGEIGQYHWGSTRKAAMIGWEAALAETTNNDGSVQ